MISFLCTLCHVWCSSAFMLNLQSSNNWFIVAFLQSPSELNFLNCEGVNYSFSRERSELRIRSRWEGNFPLINHISVD